jgi:hypothetical protein
MKLRATPVVVTAEASATRLRASLSVTNPVASARVAYARADVSAVTPSAAVSYVLPVSSIAYIELAVGMYVDETGRYRYITDTTTAVDSAALGYSKTATPDDFSIADVNTLSTDKGLSDSAVMSDTLVTVLIFIRQFTDTASPTDAPALFISPAYSDTVTTSFFD